METIRRRGMRPYLMLAGGAAVIAALLVVPLPYQRTVGHEVTVAVGPMPGAEAQVARVARSLKRAMNAGAVRVEAGAGGLTLTADVPARSRRTVEKQAEVLGRALAAQGITAKTTIEPRTERVLGSLVAMAMEQLIQVRVDLAGKTEAEVEAEIRDQLVAGGIENPTVEVQLGDKETRVDVTGTTERGQVRIAQRVKSNDGAPQQIKMDIGGIDETREPGMTDEQLEQKILDQLRARGLDGKVKVKGDQVEIQVKRRVVQEQQ